MPGRMELQFTLPKSAAMPRRRDDAECPRILVMADFSGRAGRTSAAAPDFTQRAPRAVTVDTLDAIMAQLQPQLRLTLAAGLECAIRFQQLDDFHPDALYQRLELFQTLRRTRARLLDPAHFAQAMAELTPSVNAEPVHSEPPAQENDTALLDRLLGRAPATPTPVQAAVVGATALQQWLRTIVEPHIVHTDPRQKSWVAAVDAALSEQMRSILHQPAFQALEASWRGLQSLVAHLEEDNARVFLLDVTQQELLLDLRAAQGNPTATGLYALLIERGVTLADGQPWTLWVGDYDFGAEPEDLALLTTLGALAAEAGGPLLAAAKPALLGCDTAAALADPARWTPLPSTAQSHWQTLRRGAVAPWLGLALPRVLLRLPYGPKTDAVEAFAFEEMAGGRDPAAYLWGNPAFACARLIAAAFAEQGWDFVPGAVVELEDCPVHVYEEAGERALQPATEVLLGERAIQAILAGGLMPLLGHRQRNALRLVRFQSLAEPSTALAGAWRS